MARSCAFRAEVERGLATPNVAKTKWICLPTDARSSRRNTVGVGPIDAQGRGGTQPGAACVSDEPALATTSRLALGRLMADLALTWQRPAETRCARRQRLRVVRAERAGLCV